MSEIVFRCDFKFSLNLERPARGQVLPEMVEMVPLKDTRAPFNSSGWFAHVTIAPGATVSYKLAWKKFDQAALSKIEQLSIQLGSPEMARAVDTGMAPWGQVIEVTPDELKSPSGSGSSKGEPYDFNDYGPNEASIRIVWRLKEVPESAARSAGRALAAQNRIMLASPIANNVRFIFPRDGGRELWANSSVLATVSPYFKMSFDWRAPEITTSNPSTSLDASFLRSPLGFDDSDDDDALADPPLLAPEPCKYPHHTIEITESSYITYHAVLIWILSHHIDFRPRDANPTPHEAHSSTLPVLASPRSVYRLAHFLEISELQTLALEAIRSQVTVATVVADLFSETSGKYPAVLDVLCQFMVENREKMREAGNWDEIARRVKETEWGGDVLTKVLASVL
ncbi:hypothetical protein RQP46_002303 [Phenoliferia psychrophenolica]